MLCHHCIERHICLQHQKGKLTDKDMYRVCGTYDSEIFCKFIKEDDFYYNKKKIICKLIRFNPCSSPFQNSILSINI